jgi:hypothetical protein
MRHGVSLSNLPQPVNAFIHALASRNHRALAAAFAENAVLTDMSRRYHGEEIANWNDPLFFAPGTMIRPINSFRRGMTTTVTVVVCGGSPTVGATQPLQLECCFTIAKDKIASLTMTREKEPDVPAPVAEFIRATNTFDLDRLMATFADDAIVNDQLREFWGKAAIRKWAEREIIGERVTMYVVNVIQHYGTIIITANMDGDYDKRGLPDPFVLAFYIWVPAGKIVQLIILHNQRPD